MNPSDTSPEDADRQAAEGPNLKPNEVAPGVSREEFEARHPDDPANAPGWDKHVKEFFDREVFPGEKVRKATDAMKDDQIEDGQEGRSPPVRGGSSQGAGDRKSLEGETDTEQRIGRHPQPKPGEG